MIPVRLELYNFLAYRSPDALDLTGIHMACLVGANGAGKSSLLDAITWALWGKARTHSDNELIHGEEIEMQVKLTFQLEGNTYRATRYRSRKGQGSSALALEVQDGDDWRSISEATIRATQDRLTALLRLDYSTFINSAFLVQGRADEFTRKTPGERKAILGEILGLDAWRAYEDRAKARLKDIEQEQALIDSQIEGIDLELGREGQYKDDLIAAQQRLEVLHKQVDEAQQLYNELQADRQQLYSVRQRCEDLRARVGQAQAELSHLEAERDQNARRLEELQALLASRHDIEAGYQAWQAARQQERDLSARLMEHSSLLEQLGSVREAISAARARLEAQQASLEQRRADVQRRAAAGGDSAALEKARREVAELEQHDGEVKQWRDELASYREEQARLEGAHYSLRAEIERLASQIEQLSTPSEAVCPLCGQPLSPAHRAELLASLAAQRDEKKAEWQAGLERVETVSASAAVLGKHIKTVEPRLRNLGPKRDLLGRLTERATRADESQSEMVTIGAELAQVEAALAGSAYAEQEQSELAGLQARLADVGYNEREHQAVQAAAARYEGYEARKIDLDRALEGVPQVEEAIRSLAERIAGWQATLGGDQAALAASEGEMRALEDRLQGFDQLERRLSDLRDQEGDARSEVGAAEQKVNALGSLRKRRQELSARRDRLGQERGIFEELRTAFGKDGVPAMIIEAAIPEIEQGANQILARMTDGRMNIRFDTQREKVTGGVKETLDINIADELGTRDYATFSGGETFRVNFAIRLALSRLLANRAGAQLRTLIIDEGFGTQDAQGRERLVQAINAIQEDFDLILVITHIDELKDAFPARIEVTKTPAGSQIELI